MLRPVLPAIVLMLSGCATTAPTTERGVASADGAGGSPPAPREAQSAARDEDNVDDIVSVAEVPRAESPAVTAAPRPPEKVCRREKRTGSHRTQVVCYTQTEVDAATTDARQVFDELHRQQRLPGGN